MEGPMPSQMEAPKQRSVRPAVRSSRDLQEESPFAYDGRVVGVEEGSQGGVGAHLSSTNTSRPGSTRPIICVGQRSLKNSSLCVGPTDLFFGCVKGVLLPA